MQVQVQVLLGDLLLRASGSEHTPRLGSSSSSSEEQWCVKLLFDIAQGGSLVPFPPELSPDLNLSRIRELFGSFFGY